MAFFYAFFPVWANSCRNDFVDDGSQKPFAGKYSCELLSSQ